MDAPLNHTHKNVILSFQAIADLSLFKQECACNDFYIDRDEVTLVGVFTEEQIKMAAIKYAAQVKETVS